MSRTRQRNFSRRQFAGSSSIGAEAFSQHRSVRVGEADLTFTAAFATPDGRHQLHLIDIHIDKGRIDGRPDDSTPPSPLALAIRAGNFVLRVKVSAGGISSQPHPHHRLRRGFTSAKINSAATDRGESREGGRGRGKSANSTHTGINSLAASPPHRRSTITRPNRDAKAKPLSSPPPPAALFNFLTLDICAPSLRSRNYESRLSREIAPRPVEKAIASIRLNPPPGCPGCAIPEFHLRAPIKRLCKTRIQIIQDIATSLELRYFGEQC